MEAEAAQVPLYPSDPRVNGSTLRPWPVCALPDSINTGQGSRATAAEQWPSPKLGKQPFSQHLGWPQHTLPKNATTLTEKGEPCSQQGPHTGGWRTSDAA